MEYIVEPERKTPVSASCGVLVCGGGTSGACAAIAAARNGAKTILVERESSPGGTPVHSLVTPLMTFHASPGRQIVKGIAEELVRDAVKMGGSPGHVPDPLGVAATITPIDPEILKICIIKMCAGSGVELFNDSCISGILKADSGVTGIIIESKSGRRAITAGVTIDATGDGDVAAAAGVPFSIGRERDGKTQPMTLMAVVGGVDNEKVRAYIKNHPGEFILSAYARKNINKVKFLAVSGFFSLVKNAQKKGELENFRDRVLYFEMPRCGEVALNMTRITGMSGLDPKDISRAQQLGFEQMLQSVEFLRKYAPGFENSYIVRIAEKIGVRETRHIRGLYTLTAEDVLYGRDFKDAIARGAFPIDIHSPDGSALEMKAMKPGTSYGIPYRCMLPEKIENLIVTGRAISATHEASASARVSPTCMALGQAAGTAAAIAVKKKIPPSKVSAFELRNTLKKQGAVV
ncbi:MAG: hypothetical protein A2270_00495 [Elusimicrobia bacterium RIFOXYA12_FULL_51_18]|nr:MAG: hypothetical protein A2270_00495 [Elusimicrobia bacterium RIFOXYA12_FULL_51_18]OGS28977.1 MAG: hypothetical protein A2218_08510 [Elusimicrobia bacterium RIFOXYA2_FULL_53_38]